jgi:eukaryotic-like serine/threonine-protein kinase
MSGVNQALVGVPEVGALIAGKYRLGEKLAKGGMGVVCAGAHEALDQQVAIKFLLPESSTKPEIVERFLREARAAAKIQSDHVVRVYDVGSHEGTPYMVMEYLEGSDFSRLLDDGGALPIDETVEYVCQALEAVAEAHRIGIVHRDLKPANLFLALRSDGSTRVKVLDFGISKVDQGRDLNAALTSTHVMLGSPGYMSPEQVRSTKGVDARTDIWSIGVILYEALTGTVAYTGETLGDIFAKIREESLPPLRSVRAEVPTEIEAIVSKCLERKRENRFADGRELLQALSPFRKGRAAGDLLAQRVKQPEREKQLSVPEIESLETVRATSAAGPLTKPMALSVPTIREADNAINATNSTWTSGEEPPRRPGRRFLFAGAGALALIVIGALVFWSRSDPEPSATALSAVPAEASVPAPRASETQAVPSVDFAPLPSAAVEPSATQPAAPNVPRARASKPAARKATTASPPPAVKKRPAARDDLGI